MNPENLIPILITLGAFTMVFGLRYLVNKENMAMIERGMTPERRSRGGYGAMRFGLLAIGAGLGLCLAYLLDNLALKGLNNNEAVYFGMIGIFGGAGLFMANNLERKMRVQDKKDDIV